MTVEIYDGGDGFIFEPSCSTIAYGLLCFLVLLSQFVLLQTREGSRICSGYRKRMYVVRVYI